MFRPQTASYWRRRQQHRERQRHCMARLTEDRLLSECCGLVVGVVSTAEAVCSFKRQVDEVRVERDHTPFSYVLGFWRV